MIIELYVLYSLYRLRIENSLANYLDVQDISFYVSKRYIQIYLLLIVGHFFCLCGIVTIGGIGFYTQ